MLLFFKRRFLNLMGGESPFSMPHRVGQGEGGLATPFISGFKNYNKNVCELVGVYPVNETCKATNRDF